MSSQFFALLQPARDRLFKQADPKGALEELRGLDVARAERTLLQAEHSELQRDIQGLESRTRIVAVARELFVDLWRWRTGRVSAEKLGWILSAPRPSAKAVLGVAA